MHGIEFESRNPADWAHGVTCAVFLIHGKSDKTIPYKHSEQIFERLDTFKELWLVEGTGHTKAFSSSPAEYVRRVADFFNGIRATCDSNHRSTFLGKSILHGGGRVPCTPAARLMVWASSCR